MLTLGAALLSKTPGGVGPFEFMILGLLPELPTSEMLGSIVLSALSIMQSLPCAISMP
jgi:phosphatidylglycerol lysyltransferase